MNHKTIIKYKFFFNRDFIYKTKIQNVHDIICLKNFVASQQVSNNLSPYEIIASFIILFDALPFLVKSRKTTGVKTSKILSHIKQTLSLFTFFDMIIRMKHEEAFNLDLINQLNMSDLHFIRFSIKPGIFDEFLDLYEYFSELSDIYISCNIVNCKNQEEKKLLVSGLFSI